MTGIKSHRTVYFILFIINVSATANVLSTDTLHSYLEDIIDKSWLLSNVNPDSALLLTNSALNVANFEHLKKERAELLRVKGIIYFYKVDFAGALSYFIKSRDLNREIGDKSGEAAALNNISLIYRRQGLAQQSLEMDKQVLNMRLEIGDSSKIAASLNNLAVAYQDLTNYSEALKHYRKAVSISYAIDELEPLDLYYNNIGAIYLKLKQNDSAYYYFHKSLKYSKLLNDKQMISNSLAYLGEYYIAIHDFDNAIDYLQQSLALAKEIGIVYEIESAAKKLHIAYAQKGIFQEAYKMHVLFKQMGDSANNQKTIQKITELESYSRYEKEKEIQRLYQEHKDIESELALNKQTQFKNIAIVMVFCLFIFMFLLYQNYRRKSVLNEKLISQRDEILSQKEEIESQRDEIEELNNTKDKFFAIIAHDLKNPISGIYKLSEVLQFNTEGIEVGKQYQYIEQIYVSAKKTYELLENLLRWAMVQTGALKISTSEFNLTTVIKDNLELLNGNVKQKQLKVDFPVCDDCIAMADEKMITTVIRNLLHNAIKFSPENSSIQFNITDENDFWQISIADSGIGISLEDQRLLFDLKNNSSEIGVSKEKGTGLGLVLCKEFIELNNGDIWVESELNKGSTFYFTVPAVLNN